MIALIRRILDRGYAYVARSGVYFDVEKWRGPNPMGRLSRQSLEEQISEQRLEHASDKRSTARLCPLGAESVHASHAMGQPVGPRLSGMAYRMLGDVDEVPGETIDIHSGGLDHVPMDHENESRSRKARPASRSCATSCTTRSWSGWKARRSARARQVSGAGRLVAAGINPIAFRLSASAPNADRNSPSASSGARGLE